MNRENNKQQRHLSGAKLVASSRQQQQQPVGMKPNSGRLSNTFATDMTMASSAPTTTTMSKTITPPIGARMVRHGPRPALESSQRPSGALLPVVVGRRQQQQRLAVGQTSQFQQQPPRRSQATAAKVVHSALMKKAYVRFDDYLDLNEENMRRSCKRLMNHLYSDGSGPKEAMSCCRAPSPSVQLKCPPRTPPPPPTSVLTTATGAPSGIRVAEANNNQASSGECPTTTNGKSYLRSQYERRQLRQLELMNKMQQQQQPLMAPAKLQIAGGASECPQEQEQHQQQDLVAKSHELSKRRFFEQLERRESIKNLNLGQQQQTPITTTVKGIASDRQREASLATDERLADDEKGVSMPSAASVRDKQKSELDKNGDVEDGENGAKLMLKVYQSIVPNNGESADCCITNTNNKSEAEQDHQSADMLDSGSGGAFRGLLEDEVEFGSSKELAVELIGFYTPSPQSSANNNEDDQRQLIEFSLERQLERLASDGKVQENLCSHYSGTASGLDGSAFEIKVPPPSLPSADSHHFDLRANPLSSANTNGSTTTTGSLLVVKQVEVAGDVKRLLELPLVKATNVDDADGRKRPPTLNSKRLKSLSASASTPFQAANKRKTKPANDDDADDLTENKVKLIEVVHHQRRGQEQEQSNRTTISKSSKFERNKQEASSETMAFVKGSRKLMVVAPKSQLAGDNKQKEAAGISLTISGGKHNNNTTGMSKAISLELGAGLVGGGDGGGGGCFGRQEETTGQVGFKLADKLFGSTGALSSSTKTTTSASVGVAATVASSTAIEADGATNRSAKHHDGPETASASSFSQSGGAGLEEGQSSAAYLVQFENEKESAAQQVAVTQQVTSLRTTITTDKTGCSAEIRDVLPQASGAGGTNPIEAIVSGYGRHLSKAGKGKVIVRANQVQQQLAKQDEAEYANPLAAQGTGGGDGGGKHTGKNNVNHELSGYNTSAAILCRHQEQANIDLLALDGHQQHLIKSSPIKHPVLVEEKQRQSGRDGSVQEEDEGSSSCSSSSGFGPSVSVTSRSSMDGSQSRSPKLKTCSDDFNRPLRSSGSFPATSHEQGKTQGVEAEEEESNGPEEPHYDRVRSVRDHHWTTNQQANQMGSPCQTALDKKTIDEGEGGCDAFHDYKELVGPDQAYPGQYNHHHHHHRRRHHHHHYHHHHQLPTPATLLVENHNYAPLLNRSSCADPTPGNSNGNSNSNSKLDYYSTSIVLERDSLLEGYANLPIARNNKPPVLANHVVEYATVRQQQMEISGSKKRGQVIENCSGAGSEVSGLSGHSYSSSGSSSAKSGGFSALPPAPRLLGDCSAGEEQQQSMEAGNTMGTRKRASSLLKRFGSLVSKAFMGNAAIGAQSPATSKINESFAAPGASDVSYNVADGQQPHDNNAFGAFESGGPKSVLVMESNDDHQEQLATSEEAADVSNGNDKSDGAGGGPGKGSNVKEKPDLVILPTKNHVDQRKQLQSADLTPVRHHDDRLSRETKKQHSRKIKSNDSSSSSVTSLSSSLSSSSGTGSVSDPNHHRRRHHHLGARRHNHHHKHHHGHHHHHHHRRHTKKSDSLFEDLESLMSPSEDEEASRQSPTCYRKKENSPRLSRRRASSSGRRQKIDIDCVSPTNKSPKHAIDTCGQSVISRSSGPRSLLRLFSPSSVVNSSQQQHHQHLQSQEQPGKATAESTPNLATSKTQRREKRDTSQCDINEQQPASGFWGFSSLISQNHATVAKTSRLLKQRMKLEAKRGEDDRDSLEHNKSANLKPLEAGCELGISDMTTAGRKQRQSQDVDSKHQSLNLYRNLLRNYTKRSHHRLRGHHHYHHYHHGHHGHHHHHHHRHQLLATANAATVAATTVGLTAGSCARQHRSARCTQGFGKNCPTKLSANNATGNASSSDSTTTHTCCSDADKLVSVWGQLIKINKTDGSQVIELQRSPGKSWGFFVARGAINNVKGIFISRMHDKVTSDSLTGLLSIGDRILAIDECPIEPDYDILRVNQMISKKSKILLKVKPFKG